MGILNPKKLSTDPLGTILAGVGSALGIGETAADRSLAQLKRAALKALQGNRDSLGLVMSRAGSNYPEVRKRARHFLMAFAGGNWHPQLGFRPLDGVPDWIRKKSIERLTQLGIGPERIGKRSWEDTTGTAPAAVPSSAPPPSPSTPTSAQPAPSKPIEKPPCGPGKERNPATGRCRKIPASEIVSFKGGAKTPKAKPDCRYGPRVSRDDSSVLDPAGVCPKSDSPHYTGRVGGRGGRASSTRQTQAMRRAQATAEKVVYGGLTGAAKAIRAGWVASGLTAGAAATTVALVAAAAAAGWLIGQQINKVLSGEDRQEAEMRAANDRRHARAALEQELGRRPTLDEQKPITDAYNKRLALIRAGGFR